MWHGLLVLESFLSRKLRERRLVPARFVGVLCQVEFAMNSGVNADAIAQIVAVGAVEANHAAAISKDRSHCQRLRTAAIITCDAASATRLLRGESFVRYCS